MNLTINNTNMQESRMEEIFAQLETIDQELAAESNQPTELTLNEFLEYEEYYSWME
jgi:hypothetical protein